MVRPSLLLAVLLLNGALASAQMPPNESLPTTFYYFTEDQIAACEIQLDPGMNGMCTWEQQGTGTCM